MQENKNKVLCPSCKKEAQWVDNKVVYGRSIGKNGSMCYWCGDCDYYVGTHNGGRIPLGIMADKETRIARMEAHQKIDALWKSGEMKRKEVYKKLGDIFGREIHIGSADIELCMEIMDLVL